MEDDKQPELVVTGIHTMTSVYVRDEDGAKFPFFALDVFVGPDSVPGPRLLFDPELSLGIMGDIIKMFKVIHAVSDEMPHDPNQMEIPFDPDSLPPPPDDPYDMRDPDHPDPPDTTGDR